MADINFSSYFYGDEAMQFTYFRIPCQLITHPRFKHLFTDSKLLYRRSAPPHDRRFDQSPNRLGCIRSRGGFLVQQAICPFQTLPHNLVQHMSPHLSYGVDFVLPPHISP